MYDECHDSFDLLPLSQSSSSDLTITPRRSPVHIRFMANPQSPSTETILPFISLTSSPQQAKEIHNNPYKRKSAQQVSWLFLMCIFVGCSFGYVSRQVVGSTTAQVLAMEGTRNLLHEKSLSVASELDLLKRQISAINMMTETTQNAEQQNNEIMKVSNVRAMHQMMKAQDRVDQFSRKANALKKKIQASSLAGIYEKYGDGLHRVEFELVFADDEGGPTKFVLELAPSELMPHSVESFLDMVSNKLIDGCSFIMSALDVIKASPIPYDGTSAKDKAQSFADFGLDQLGFKEYSEHYPHQKYTMGFTADGSPNFFINTADNTFSHEGDPCFGKVVLGFDTIKRLESTPTRNGIWFTHRIGIKSARILDNESSSNNNNNIQPKI